MLLNFHLDSSKLFDYHISNIYCLQLTLIFRCCFYLEPLISRV